MDRAGVEWRKLERIAERQHGVVTSGAVRQCKVPRALLRWRLEQGQLVRLYEGVFRFSGSRASWEQRATAVLLWLGPTAALSHSSAASVHSLDGYKLRPSVVEVLVPHAVNTRRLKHLPANVMVHRTRAAFGTTVVVGFRVTDLTRTLLDLGRIAKEPTGLDDQLEDALDSAQRMYPWAETELDAALKVRRGRKGAGRLKRLLDARDGHATESALEAKVARALRLAKLPRPTHQRKVSDGDGYVTRLDFSWPAEKVALHVDGYTYHQQRTQFESDRLLATRLTGLDWHSIWVTHRMLKDDAWLRALRTVLEVRAPQRKLL